MASVGIITGRPRATYVEIGLVALLVFAAMVSIPEFNTWLASIATRFVANFQAV